MTTCMEMAVPLAVAIVDLFDGVLFCAVLFPRDVFDEIELSQVLRIFLPPTS